MNKIYIEQVFAEKPGGGMVKSPEFDARPGTAVGRDPESGLFQLIKSYKLAADVAEADTDLALEKGSGVKAGDFIATGSVAVEVTAVDGSNPDKDVVTAALGLNIKAGAVLYQAKEASADAAAPIMKPVFVTGDWIEAGKGDQAVRLINGANLREETAVIAPELLQQLCCIHLV